MFSLSSSADVRSSCCNSRDAIPKPALVADASTHLGSTVLDPTKVSSHRQIAHVLNPPHLGYQLQCDALPNIYIQILRFVNNTCPLSTVVLRRTRNAAYVRYAKIHGSIP
ncbi:uncharacterized protein ALTATR162_LOCUS1865 [Alternaria atra]|uniref:Uncharacterized protein n=1 Tax=Alternaria atra TaxID=119953 RepID=A0A8J2MWS5_9PLEO|nr:uncharacterized protein ALTATR162_LOCUS1865 [Alternaria atra]CAG5146358.1 unnamed protein product [Alternaria atra]